MEDRWAHKQREADCPTLDPTPGDGAELQVLPKDLRQLSAERQGSACQPLLLPLPRGSLFK